MDILFASEDLRELCEDERAAQRKLGKPVAKKLALRLTQLRAAPRLSDYTFGNPHPLKGDLAGCFGIWLDGGIRLVVRPADDPLPLLPDGGLDRRHVTIVRVEYLGNYHG